MPINSNHDLCCSSDYEGDSAGFTLVEIAVAVAILGVALVSLIGLQTRMMDTYVNEKNRFQAALALQYVASILETQAQPPEIGSKSEEFEKTLEELGFFDVDSSDEKKLFRFEGWQYDENVEGIGLPTDREELAEDAIRKISMRVSWGVSEDEQYILVYFVAKPLNIPNVPGASGIEAGGNPATGGANP